MLISLTLTWLYQNRIHESGNGQHFEYGSAGIWWIQIISNKFDGWNNRFTGANQEPNNQNNLEARSIDSWHQNLSNCVISALGERREGGVRRTADWHPAPVTQVSNTCAIPSFPFEIWIQRCSLQWHLTSSNQRQVTSHVTSKSSIKSYKPKN